MCVVEMWPKYEVYKSAHVHSPWTVGPGPLYSDVGGALWRWCDALIVLLVKEKESNWLPLKVWH